MGYKILVLNPPALRDAMQQNDKLFDAVKQLVEEYADARDLRWHHLATQPSVAVTRFPERRLEGEEDPKTAL